VISRVCRRHRVCNRIDAVSPRPFLVLAILAGCAGDAPPGVPEEPSPDGGRDPGDGGDPEGTPTDGPFAPATLAAAVTQLSTGDCADRSPGTLGDRLSAELVANRFLALGLEPLRQQLTDPAGKTTENVIALARTSATSNDAIVIGAHRDTLPASNGTALPGANANASGTAALLAIAEALAAEPAPARQIVFVSFGAGENPVAFGASQFIQQLPPELLASIVLMVDLDTIGSYSVEETLYALGASTSTTGMAILEKRGGDSFPLVVDLDSAGDDSDHEPFCAAGIPYTTFFTPDPDCYHQSCDTPDRIDSESLSLIAQLAAGFASELATTTADLARERATDGCVDR